MKTFHSDLIVCVPKKVPPTIFAAARVVSEHTHVSTFDICEQPDNVNLFPRHFNMHFYSFYASFLALSILCFRASRDCAQ